MNFRMNISQYQLLNGQNYQKWKADIELNLAILDIYQVLKQDQLDVPTKNASKEVKEKYKEWVKHNKMALICIKNSMNDAVKGGIHESEFAKDYYSSIAEKYKIYDKAEQERVMDKLIAMRYNGTGIIKEYMMYAANIAEKLRGLKMTIDESFLVTLVLNSFPEEHSHLKSLYNTQEENWSLNKLISICVQEEEDKIKRGKAVTVNYINKPKKNFGNKNSGNKYGASSSGTNHDLKKGKFIKNRGAIKCFFCKKSVHFKKNCEGFKNLLKKKGIIQTNNFKKE